MNALPKKVKIVEVGPRDGLQNESGIIDVQTKVELVDRLSATGLRQIEVSSFVSPKRIPQLSDAKDVFRGIKRIPTIAYTALVPNKRGMQDALDAKVDAIAVFTAVSETFCQRNIRCSVSESLNRFVPVIDQAKQHDLPVRAYISCVLGCPYEGFVAPRDTVDVARRLSTMGCDEISLGDTIGAGTPVHARTLINAVAASIPVETLAVHFHDTRGQALANILACLEEGVSIIDASVAGLGGCPYAEGATGNVATEDVVYMLHGMDIETGIDLDKLISVGQFISQQLQRRNHSRVAGAGVPYDYTSYQSA